MNMSNLNLNEFFSSKFFLDQRWTIAEPSLARCGRDGIAMTIDGPPENAMTIGELHCSLSTGSFSNLKFSRFITNLAKMQLLYYTSFMKNLESTL